MIAIDGPAGAGKSTVARLLARRVGLKYIDSGAMYRCVALKSHRERVRPDDERTLTECAREIKIEFFPAPPGRPDENQLVLMDGEDVSRAIRKPEIGNLASVVSQVAGVREAMVAAQRRMGRDGGVVMEGRDIGTVVFPDAPLKVFLTASAAERAVRRTKELAQSSVGKVDPELVRREMAERDTRDQSRDLAPLVPAKDAVVIATDGLTIE